MLQHDSPCISYNSQRHYKIRAGAEKIRQLCPPFFVRVVAELWPATINTEPSPGRRSASHWLPVILSAKNLDGKARESSWQYEQT